MPCTDGGVPYPKSEEEVLNEQAPHMLCAVLSAFPQIMQNLDKIDWHEAGVTLQDFCRWHDLHKARDESRKQRARLNAIQQKQVAEAIAKLSKKDRKALGLS